MRLLFALVLLVLFASVLAITEEEKAFNKFQKTYHKTYKSQAEYDFRFEVFRINLKRAKQLDLKDPLATHGVTKFSDLTEAEFRSKFLNPSFQSPLMKGKEVPVWQATFPKALPPSFDWRNATPAVVTPPYDQQQCGGCWAFSTTENIESMWARAGHPLTQLSMQQLISCDTTDQGCNGGDPPTAYQYVISAGGIESYQAYPFTSGNGNSGTCNFQSGSIAATIHNWTYVTTNQDESAIQSWLYQNGPPSICVDASTWNSYTGGIISGSACGNTLDHCVQLTGWEFINGTTAWLVRNSWGPDWGYGGYVYVQMGADVCGIAQEVTSSVI